MKLKFDFFFILEIDVLQALKYSSKSHPSSGDHRHEKMRDAHADPSPPNKMLRKSDSPVNTVTAQVTVRPKCAYSQS